MNWKKRKEIRLSELQKLEIEIKNKAKIGWKSMSEAEKENLRKDIDFRWDKMAKYAKAKMSKDDFIKFETQEHCVKVAKKLNKLV